MKQAYTSVTRHVVGTLALHIAQPTLSKHIEQLEEELVCRLFERNRRRTTLTDVGRLVLEDAIQIVDSCEMLQLKVGRASSRCHSLRVGGVIQNPYTMTLLSAIDDEFTRTGRRLFLELDVKSTGLDALASKDVDLLFGFSQLGDDEPGLVHIPLFHARLFAVMGNDHPLADRASLSIDELRDEPIIAPTGEYFADGWRCIESICTKHGFSPRQRGVFAQAPLDLLLVETGDGVFIVSQRLASSFLAGKRTTHVAIPLTDDDACFKSCIIYRKSNPNPALPLFIDALETITSRNEMDFDW